MTKKFSVPVFRVPAGSTIQVELFDNEGCHWSTHFFGQTILCAGNSEHLECPACEWQAATEKVYRLVRTVTDGRIRLMEISYLSYVGIKTMFSGTAMLKAGDIVEFKRKHKRAPVYGEKISSGQGQEAKSELTLARAISPIFHLPIPPKEMNAEIWLGSHQHIMANQAKIALKKQGLVSGTCPKLEP